MVPERPVLSQVEGSRGEHSTNLNFYSDSHFYILRVHVTFSRCYQSKPSSFYDSNFVYVFPVGTHLLFYQTLLRKQVPLVIVYGYSLHPNLNYVPLLFSQGARYYQYSMCNPHIQVYTCTA
jgi:hypothetical protein